MVTDSGDVLPGGEDTWCSKIVAKHVMFETRWAKNVAKHNIFDTAYPNFLKNVLQKRCNCDLSSTPGSADGPQAFESSIHRTDLCELGLQSEREQVKRENC